MGSDLSRLDLVNRCTITEKCLTDQTSRAAIALHPALGWRVAAIVRSSISNFWVCISGPATGPPMLLDAQTLQSIAQAAEGDTEHAGGSCLVVPRLLQRFENGGAFGLVEVVL